MHYGRTGRLPETETCNWIIHRYVESATTGPVAVRGGGLRDEAGSPGGGRKAGGWR